MLRAPPLTAHSPLAGGGARGMRPDSPPPVGEPNVKRVWKCAVLVAASSPRLGRCAGSARVPWTLYGRVGWHARFVHAQCA